MTLVNFTKLVAFLLFITPLVTAISLLFSGTTKERSINAFVKISMTFINIFAVILTVLWVRFFQDNIVLEYGTIPLSESYPLDLVVYVNSATIVWLVLTSFLSTVVCRFSLVYMHKDPGYKRFFVCINLMIFGLIVLAIAGTLDLFIIGWEFVGIASFLLIGFYRERTITVVNAYKVYSIYRISDAGLLLGAWLSHHIWHGALRFDQIESHISTLSIPLLFNQPAVLTMTLLILIAASGKSAQFPFSFWISKALEGPTPSSAIFYGALSIHAGAFLLIRTQPIWSHDSIGALMIGTIGAITVLTCGLFSRVQSNIKAKIGFSSCMHVGIIFIEVALGFTTLAMIHMVLNALLRSYQLLTAPSSLVSLLRLKSQETNFVDKHSGSSWIPFAKSIKSTLYMFSLFDGFQEGVLRRLIWTPMHLISRWTDTIKTPIVFVIAPSLVIAGVSYGWSDAKHNLLMSSWMSIQTLPALAVFVSIAVASYALSERRSAVLAWNSSFLSLVLAASSLLFIDPHATSDVMFFVTGIGFFWILGMQSLLFLRDQGSSKSLRTHRGLVHDFPRSSTVLFIATLGLSGFPVGPGFFGQDMILHHAVDEVSWLAFAIATVFAINALALMRLYVRLSFGKRSILETRDIGAA